MGSLKQMSREKVTAVLEKLEHLGVTGQDWLGVLKDSDLAGRVADAWKAKVAKSGVFVRPKRPRRPRKLPARPLSESEQKEWQAFYRDVLELEVNLAEVVVPPPTASRRPSR